jgi:hypothetical protein
MLPESGQICGGQAAFWLSAVSRRTSVHKFPFLEFSPILPKWTPVMANAAFDRLKDKRKAGGFPSFQHRPEKPPKPIPCPTPRSDTRLNFKRPNVGQDIRTLRQQVESLGLTLC